MAYNDSIGSRRQRGAPARQPLRRAGPSAPKAAEMLANPPRGRRLSTKARGFFGAIVNRARRKGRI